MGRTPCCSKVGLHRGAWSAEEDELLTNYIQAHGEGNWRSLPKKAGLLRCGKSCRLRWKNYLCPSIKRGNITPDEEDLIIRLHSLLGNRWSLIAARLPARTDNEIKNHWNTRLVKRFKSAESEPKSNKNIAKIPAELKKVASPMPKDFSASTESNNASTARKKNNSDNNYSDGEPFSKIKIFVPKPIRIFSRFSSSKTNSSPSSGEVNKEAMAIESHFGTEANADEVSHSAWPFVELRDANYYSGSDQLAEDNQVLIPDCEFSFKDFLAETVLLQDPEAVSSQDLLPSSSNILEKIYNEYLELL